MKAKRTQLNEVFRRQGLIKLIFMKYFKILPFLFSLILFTGCDKKPTGSLLCNQFTLDNTFTARLNQEWCLKDTEFKISFGPFIEDSRCNVPEIACVWAGRYVMGATFENGESIQDTFFAVHNWTDTLYHSGYKIILEKVYPVTRVSMEPLPAAGYSFDVRVKQ